jgi:LytS/YehU family sensor histidine kinase
LFATSLFRLARGWFRLQEIEKEKTLTELKALKSQINPHFLFNSLNNIYSLARRHSDLVPEKIIQLSDLMRHLLYESDVEFIKLSREVDMIKNHIELQRLRTSKEDNIELNVAGDIENKKIAPLLFLPFVENSFKHGLKSGINNAFVRINIEVAGSILNFEIENNKGMNVPVEDTRYKGIGIENVKKRLELIYPGLHKLKIWDNEKTFKVYLRLQLK